MRVTPPTTIAAPNGDEFDIIPRTTGITREALRTLARKNIRVNASTAMLDEGIDLQMELTRAVLKEWRIQEGDGFTVASKSDIEELILNRAKVVKWINKKSDELAEAGDKEFDAELGNS